MKKIVGFVTKILESDVKKRLVSLKILIALLENCDCKIFLVEIVELIIAEMQKEEMKDNDNFPILFRTLSFCLFYDTHGTTSLITPDFFTKILDALIANIDFFKKKYYLRCAILGIASCAKLGPLANQKPPGVVTWLPDYLPM